MLTLNQAEAHGVQNNSIQQLEGSFSFHVPRNQDEKKKWLQFLFTWEIGVSCCMCLLILCLVHVDSLCLFLSCLPAVFQKYEPCPGITFCLELTPEEVSALPALAFELAGGVRLEISPHQYLEKAMRGKPLRAAYAPR